MKGEIICIGTELLLGDTLNSNSQYLSQELAAMGINLYFHTVVGDNVERLKTIMSLALERSDIIVTTGGLGPTQDDLTKETIAQLLEMPLEIDKSSLELMYSFLNINPCQMTSNNLKQTYVPKGSIVVPNGCGTAPGIIIEKNNKIIIMLPGPPKEIAVMLKKHIIPYISNKIQKTFYSRYYKVIGIGESSLENELIDIIDQQTNPTLATYAGDNEVLLRLTVSSEDELNANEILQTYEDIIYSRMGDCIYGGKQDTLEHTTANLLIQKELTFSIAESCTGGMVASRLTTIPNISKVFHSGIVCYSNDAKENIVGVPHDILKSKGAVSPEVAEALCKELYKKTKTDIVMSITGYAGPEGDKEKKFVGLIYIGLLYNNVVEISTFNLKGDRNRVQKQASQLALNTLRKKIININ